MAETITLRPTAEAWQIISRLKEEGANVSRYINGLIVSADVSSGKDEAVSTVYRCYPEKENISMADVMGASPISMLNIRRYKEFLHTLEESGMQYHYFRIDEDHTIGLIAVNREEASILFSQLYIQDQKTKEYMRTELPLPVVRYDPISKRVIVITHEKQYYP